MTGTEGDYRTWEEISEIPQEFRINETRAIYQNGGPRDLIVWRNAMDLTRMVYGMTRSWPADERFGLTAQVRRAAVSVPANIAEGHGRFSKREFLHHLSIASGSLREVETLLEVARDADYLADDDFSQAMLRCEVTRRPLRGLFGYLKGQL